MDKKENVKIKNMEIKRRQRIERERQLYTLAHSVAEKIVAFEDITYAEAFTVLKLTEKTIRMDMDKQRATIRPEIRDSWGAIIGVSGANAPDMNQGSSSNVP